MKMWKWAVLILAVGMFAGAASGNTPDWGPYIKVGPMIQGIPELPQNWSVVTYNGFVFDTHTGEPALPAGLRITSYPKGTTGYYLVTLRVPITEAVKTELTARGAKLIIFMPYNSYLVAMNEAEKAQVETSPSVSWVGIFQPAYKIASSFKGSGIKDVWVQTFPDENIQSVATKLRGMGFSSVSIEDPEMYKILKVRMDLASLDKVVGLREVMWTEPWPECKVVNKDAQWTTQTNLSGVRKLWDRGVDGHGEVVNTADTGINTAHMFFYDSAYPITAAGNFPNHRKIIGY